MKIFHYILLLQLFSSIAFAQKPKLPAEVKSSIEQRIEFGINSSIAVGIISDKGVSYYCFGLKDAGKGKVDEHSLYEIGSITKTFTATLLANEVVHGKMKLDDPVQEYLPDQVRMPVYENQVITLGHLSDHTSSLPRMPTNMAPADPLNPYADYTPDLMYAFLSGCSLSRPIGSKYEYSNLAVGLLGHLLARHAGMSYEDLLKKVVLEPLGMKETTITFNEEDLRNLANGHSGGMSSKNWDLGALQGAGAIRSNVHDMLLYLKAQMEPENTPLADAIALTHVPRHDHATGAEVGLAWFIDPEQHIIFHNGATGGYFAFAGFDPERKLGVVVLTNSDNDIEDIGLHLLVPENQLKSVRPLLAHKLREMIEKDGAEDLTARYLALKSTEPDKYEINEESLNSLGYDYMARQNLKAASGIFEINVIEFPASSNVYDSYGEALMETGHQAQAILNYRKSLELNPGNTNAMTMLAKLGAPYETREVTVAEDKLKSYTGTYELVPGFNIDITQDGSRLFGQATGQNKFELFPKSDTEFYLKVVEARIVFSKNDAGETLLTLFQNGQVMPGKKLN